MQQLCIFKSTQTIYLYLSVIILSQVVDVLGIALSFEQNNSISVVATRFGIARMAKQIAFGTWVIATIEEESERAAQNPKYTTFLASNPLSYRVLQCKKIKPPMSTRVIETKGATKLLVAQFNNTFNMTLKNILD